MEIVYTYTSSSKSAKPVERPPFKPTLVVLAAGMGSRYGGLKQIDPVGPSGEAILDYSVFDAHRAGFGKVVFIIRRDIEQTFREQIGSKYEGLLPVEYVFQEIDDIPPPFTVPAGRTKPWGTAHALRASHWKVHEAFAAINADDFYGYDAFRKMAEFLLYTETIPILERHPCQYAMIGYKLRNTLSENGSVARGICRLRPDGTHLVDVTEHLKLVPTADGVRDEDAAAREKNFTGDELVSMNMWGFTNDFLLTLETRFPHWLKDNIANEKSEWYIPFAVDEAIHQGRCEVTVLPTDSRWFGVTYREDKPHVAAEILKLVEAGEYPRELFPAKSAAGKAP